MRPMPDPDNDRFAPSDTVMAQRILDMRADGRASEVTDEMMTQADPAFMYNNTPLAMDAAARMERARAAGFDADGYHGTVVDHASLKPSVMGKHGPGVYTADGPEFAGDFAGKMYGKDEYLDGGKVLPMSIRSNPAPDEYRANAEALKRSAANPFDGAGEFTGYLDDNGFTGVKVGSEQTTVNPANMRSRFARFDPEFAHLRNLSSANASTSGGLLATATSNAERMARRGTAAKANKEELDPIGYQKPKMRGYLSDTDVQTSDLGENLSRQPMSWEDMEGKVVLPFYGDRTARGLLVEGVNDLKFDQPVYTEGGVDFMRGPAAQQDRSIWASNQSIIKRIRNEADAAARDFDGADIFGVTGSMSPDANDFATFTGAAMAELVKGAKITKKSAKEFDKVMRAIDPDFVGVLSPNLRDWAVSTSSPKRKSFIRLMESAPMQEKNFPSPAEARYSVTDPSQRDMPAGMFGLGAARIDRGMPLLYNEPKGNHYRANVPHSTYNTQIAGEYAGSLPPVPQGLLFRDVYDAMEGKTTKSGNPLNEAHKTHAIKTKMPAQQITPEVLEGILNYLSRMKK